jgi:hypothetical protein
MKNKKSTSVKKILVIISFVILLLLIIKPQFKEPRTVIIIEENILPKKIANYIGTNKIYIVESPQTIEGRCGEWKNFVMKIKNENNAAWQPIFSISSSPDLKFMSPNRFIIPPESEKQMTFLVNFYCEDESNEIPIKFKLVNTTQSANIVFISKKWY